MEFSEMPTIKLEGVTKNDLGKYIGKTFKFVEPSKIQIGEEKIEAKMEGPFTLGLDKEICLGNIIFVETTPLRVISESIAPFKENAFLLLMENDKLEIILKDKIEKLMEIPMVWCSVHMRMESPPPHG